MKKNLINVVIPTRNRADTLYYCLKTVVNQDYDNLRIIVNNNSDIYKNETKEVVKSFKDKRIDYFETEGNLAMKDNYEDALNKVTDGYVMYIGDDDGITYNSINYINNLINETNSLALKCFSPTYNWKTINNKNIKNTFLIYKDYYYTIINSKEFLEQISNYISFSFVKFLPNIYNGGIISLELIQKIKSISNGKYFNGIIPDVYASIINCSELENYILFFNPIIINGISIHSNGRAFIKSDKNSLKIKNDFFKLVSQTNNINFSYSSLNICLFDSIIEAKKYSKNIPEINIKSLIDEIIYYELFEHKNNKEIYNLILKDLNLIAKEFNEEKYLYEKLNEENNYHSEKKENFYFRIPIKYTQISCNNYYFNNLYDSSIFCNTLVDKDNLLILHDNLDIKLLRENNSYNKETKIFYNNDINLNKSTKNIFFDYYQKDFINFFNKESLSIYDQIIVTNDYRKDILKKYNKKTENIFNLEENIFDKNKKTICISSLYDFELVKKIYCDVMVSYNYDKDNYYKLNKDDLIDFSINKLDEYFNIIFLDFRLDYFNKILIHLENKCFIFPKNKYIKNYKYLIEAIEIEEIYLIKNLETLNKSMNLIINSN